MSSFEKKISDLRARINNELLPLIDNRPCAYMDLPYHPNIGDILIWEGTEQFLKDNQLKCLFRNSEYTYFHREVPRRAVILLHGGGNFGDIWREHQNLRLRVIEEYPDHPIIILPQTVFYTDKALMKQDAEAMKSHPNLTICARDEVSYTILQANFPTHRILLLPDMAFCISAEKLHKLSASVIPDNRSLLVMRTDKELAAIDIDKLHLNKDSVDVRDWPSMERRPRYMRLFTKLNYYCHRAGTFAIPLADRYVLQCVRPRLLRTGVRFLQSYTTIYTTRLHVAILATLLHRHFTLLDNNYGKNSSFYRTWLKDLPNVGTI